MRTNNNFDFDKVGKNLPYQSESEFLAVATNMTLNKINRMKRRRVWKIASSIAASVVVVLGLSLFNNYQHVDPNNLSIDDLISNMSDSRLEEFVYMADSDAFLVTDLN